MSEAEGLIKKYHGVKEDRSFLDPFYLCASMYADPLGAHLWHEDGRSKPTLNWNTDLFSGVGQRGADRFANFLMGNATPAEANWLRLTDTRMETGKLDAVDAQYWADASRVLVRDLRGDALHGASFYSAMQDAYSNLAVSYGVVWVYEGESHNKLEGKAVYKHIQPQFFYYKMDELDRMTTACYVRQMRNDQIKSLTDANLIADDEHGNKTRTVLQVVTRNENPKANPNKHNEWPFREFWVDLDKKRVFRKRGYYTQPFHVMGWRRVPGSSYSIGPVYNSLPDLIGANAAKRALKKALEMVAFPPLIGGKKIQGALKTLRPGSVTWNAVSQNGRDQLKALPGLANPGALYGEVQESEQNAANGFFEFDMNLPLQGKMTATEIAQRSQQQAAMVAPFAVRIMPAIKGMITRHYDIKARAGTLPPIPPSVAQAGILGVEMMGPLSLAARQVENVAMLQTLDQIAAIEQLPSRRIDKDEAIFVVADRAGQAQFLLDPAIVAEQEKQEQQAMAQMQQAQIEAEQAKAAKAGSEAVNNVVA